MVDDWKDEDQPAGVAGAQFFGGNKQKVELFDPQAELEAATLNRQDEEATMYDRFDDRVAFSDDTTALVAKSIQLQLNGAVLQSEAMAASADAFWPDLITEYAYADNVQWTTPFSSQTKQHPLRELQAARSFYRQIHVAITSGKPAVESDNGKPSVFDLRWEISVSWPAIWEPRVKVTGTSRVTTTTVTTTTTTTATTLSGSSRSCHQIVAQHDTLDTDLIPTIAAQILPRFWDVYHIGMTPAAEVLVPLRCQQKGGLWLLPWWSTTSSAYYTLQEYAPRLVLQPSMLDWGSRDDGNAAVLPNHAFSCVISTMGPTKQRYTPVTGVQVQLLPSTAPTPTNSTKSPLELQWQIPVATEYASNLVLSVPTVDFEHERDQASCRYVLLPRRKVATVPYGGSPQDAGISEIRKRLYEQVVKDGLQPKLDEFGRPLFFFAMNSIKACYCENGLGMAVYEWRPQFTRPNEVGIELEL
jgi:hypothetical protein